MIIYIVFVWQGYRWLLLLQVINDYSLIKLSYLFLDDAYILTYVIKVTKSYQRSHFKNTWIYAKTEMSYLGTNFWLSYC